MAVKWLSGLAVLCVLAVCNTARSQEPSLWGVDNLTRLLGDASAPSAAKPAEPGCETQYGRSAVE
ncbi:MAG: hypothetical protein KJZ87_13440 [Thermoguttaceae bacterium]|nr:hypothetical protein [Thermoguttaceae bacterium]